MSNKHSRAAQAARHRRNMWWIWGGVALVVLVAVEVPSATVDHVPDGLVRICTR